MPLAINLIAAAIQGWFSWSQPCYSSERLSDGWPAWCLWWRWLTEDVLLVKKAWWAHQHPKHNICRCWFVHKGSGGDSRGSWHGNPNMNKSHHNPSHHKEEKKMGKGKIRPNIWLKEREREQERPQSRCWGTIEAFHMNLYKHWWEDATKDEGDVSKNMTTSTDGPSWQKRRSAFIGEVSLGEGSRECVCVALGRGVCTRVLRVQTWKGILSSLLICKT